MKKFLTFIFTILSAFVVFALTLSFKASASESGITMMNGAQVRTAEDTDAKQGIKFTAEVTALPEGSTHGFYVAKGDFTAAELLAKLAEFGPKSEENQTGVVSDFAVTGTNTTFSVVLYGVPESDYLQDITVLAYVKLADGTVETPEESVARNLAEVAIYNAKGELANNKLISDVVNALNDDYKTTVIDGEGNLVVTGFNVQDLGALEALFVDDINGFAGETLLTVTSTNKEWGTALCSNARGDLSDSVLYNFYQNETYKAKWGWVLEFMLDKFGAAEGENEEFPHPVNQIKNAILAGQPVYDQTIHYVHYENNPEYVLNVNYADHAVTALYNFFNKTALASSVYGGPTFRFNSISAYDGVDEYNKVSYFQLAEMTKVGESVEVPAVAPKVGYTAKWTLNGSDYEGTTYTLNAENAKFVPLYTVVDYRVRFFNGETELTELEGTYNVETGYTLPTEIEGATLLGWYDNPDLEGTPVTALEPGTESVAFYAKVATRSAEIVVDATLTEENNTTEFDGNTYTLGIDAYATIAEAVDAANKLDRIYVKPGTYGEDIVISKSDITLFGANKDVKGTAERTEETELTGVITLAEKVKNVTIQGFKFTGTSMIQVDPNIVAPTSGQVINNEDIKVVNNYISVEANANGSGFINLADKNRMHIKNVLIDGNYFTGAATSGIVTIGNNVNVTITNNQFNSVTGKAINFVSTSSCNGVSGNLNVSNNEFNSVSNQVLYCDYMYAYNAVYNETSVELLINNNIITNSSLNTNAIHFDYDAYIGGTGINNILFEINGNQFNNVGKCIYFKNATTKSADNVFKFTINNNTIENVKNGIDFLAFTSKSLSNVFEVNNNTIKNVTAFAVNFDSITASFSKFSINLNTFENCLKCLWITYKPQTNACTPTFNYNVITFIQDPQGGSHDYIIGADWSKIDCSKNLHYTSDGTVIASDSTLLSGKMGYGKYATHINYTDCFESKEAYDEAISNLD